jgi:hypothetical protein
MEKLNVKENIINYVVKYSHKFFIYLVYIINHKCICHFFDIHFCYLRDLVIFHIFDVSKIYQL